MTLSLSAARRVGEGGGAGLRRGGTGKIVKKSADPVSRSGSSSYSSSCSRSWAEVVSSLKMHHWWIFKEGMSSMGSIFMKIIVFPLGKTCFALTVLLPNLGRSDFIYTKNSARPRSDFIYTKNSPRPRSDFLYRKNFMRKI